MPTSKCRLLIPSLALVLSVAVASPVLAQQGTAPKTHEFQLILVRAGAGEASMPQLPGDALDALRDVAQLLPYDHFELIDSGWVRTDDSAKVRLGDAGSFETYLGLSQKEDDDDTLGVRHLEVSHRAFERDAEGHVFYRDAETLLATSFRLEVGETVVVGTSRLHTEDEALIVLLTAVR